jgi:hypothetical protein
MNFAASIAAAITASASKNASAGIAAASSFSSNVESDKIKRANNNFMCIHTTNNILNTKCDASSVESEQLQNLNRKSIGDISSDQQQTLIGHQIGTNLNDLTVCWHKMPSSEECTKCGQPYYKVNQFVCEPCSRNELKPKSNSLGGNRSAMNFVESIELSLLKKPTINPSRQEPLIDENTSSSAVANVISVSDTIKLSRAAKSLLNDEHDESETLLTLKEIQTLNEQASGSYLSRKSFDEEFSSLVIHASVKSAQFMLPSFDSSNGPFKGNPNQFNYGQEEYNLSAK